MTEPKREEWPRIIAELEAAGISNYKLAEMLRPCRTVVCCQVGQVKRWADAVLWAHGTEPSHFLGEQIKAIHAAYVIPAALQPAGGIPDVALMPDHQPMDCSAATAL